MKPKSFIFRASAALASLVFILICLLPYIIDASYRNSAQKWDDWEWKHDQSTEDGGKYSTRMAVFRENAYLQLYETSTGELLADRLYVHGNINRLIWTKDSVIYSTAEEGYMNDGDIELPPTRLDKIRTYFP